MMPVKDPDLSEQHQAQKQSFNIPPQQDEQRSTQAALALQHMRKQMAPYPLEGSVSRFPTNFTGH